MCAPHWHDFIDFKARAACRLGEMFFGLACDLDLADRAAARTDSARSKGRKDDHDVIPLLPEDAAMLAAWAGRAKAAASTLCGSASSSAGKLDRPAKLWRGGGALESAGIRRAMTSTGLRASKGTKDPTRCSPQRQRHEDAAGDRQPAASRSTLLGHASIQSTLVYAHAMGGESRAGLALLPRNSPEPSPGATPEAEEDQAATGVISLF